MKRALKWKSFLKQSKGVAKVDDQKAKVPDAGDNKVTPEVKSGNDANADGTSDQGSSGIQAKDDFSPSGVTEQAIRDLAAFRQKMIFRQVVERLARKVKPICRIYPLMIKAQIKRRPV